MSIFLLLGSSLSYASTITVGSGGISTIQAAIDSASSNDTISIPTGTYSECLTIGATLQNLTFVSNGTVTVNGSGCSNAAIVITGGSATFEDIEFSNSTGRVLWLDGGSVSLLNPTISGVGSSSLDGGAIYLSSAALTISGGELTGNSGDKGGVIYADNSSISISNAVFSNNDGDYAGCVYMIYSSFDGQNNTFEDNESGFNGGAIVMRYESSYTDTGSSYEANISSGGKGGAIYAEDGFNNNGSNLVLSQASFSQNSAGSNFGQSYSGGAIYMSDKMDALLTEVVFEQNIGRKGGAMAIYGVDGDVQLLNSSFMDNTVSGGGQYGGAIWAPASGSSKAVDLSVDNCTFSNNYALGFGGAIRIGGETSNSAHGTLSVSNSTFTGNDADSSASGQGGAISVHVGVNDAISISQSQFDSNESELDGAAIFIGQAGDVVVLGSSFTSNSASGQANSYDRHGGAIYAFGANSFTVSNSLFDQNTCLLTNTSNPLGRITQAGAIYVESISGDVSIHNSIFVENQSDDFGGSLGIESVGNYLIQNNTMVGNASAEGGCATFIESSGEFSNNICAYATGSAMYAADSTSNGALVQYNAWFSNANSNTGGQFSFSTSSNGNITDDPLFVAYTQDADYSNDDLHLQSSSPAIDAGTGLDNDGSPADMGAFGGANFVDADGDGYGPLSDCDDSNSAAYPGAGYQESSTTCLLDADGDGYGDIQPGNALIQSGSDCDDSNPAINPMASEVCDSVDNDCNGSIDDNPIGGQSAYRDLDSDGYGDASNGGSYCTPPVGYVNNADDCNDLDPTIHPNAVEIPSDEIDQNCDGIEDCYRDLDGDGQGGEQIATGFDLDCVDFGESLNSDDCDDSDAATYVGAAELDSTTACMTDADEDGYGDFFAASPVSFGSDCNDNDPHAYMGATEVVGDGIDQDCDNSELCFEDSDGDGYGSENSVPSSDLDCSDSGESSNSDDCDDVDSNSYPGATEVEDDGIDQDCNGEDQESAPEDTGTDDTGSEDTGEDDTGEEDSGTTSPNDTADNTGSDVGGDSNGPKEGGCTCSSSGQSSTGLWGSLFVLGFAFLRRRSDRSI